jgi:pimeloyl-ACP methyl ester carboxylesterase
VSGGASEEAPPPSAVRQALLVAPVRLFLGAAGLAAAGSIGHSFGTAVAEAGAGAGLTIFALVSPGGRRRPARLRPPEPVQSPQSWWRILAVAMFPSTYGVALLTGIALVFNRDLAAFLAGVLLGMGAIAVVYALSQLEFRL